MPPEAAVAAVVAVATVERHNMPYVAAAVAVVVVAVLLQVKSALRFVGGRRMAEAAGVEPRDTVGACWSV